jgi:hypothetical protein
MLHRATEGHVATTMQQRSGVSQLDPRRRACSRPPSQADRTNDASREWLARWDAAERMFFRRIRPPETFDIVVRGF